MSDTQKLILWIVIAVIVIAVIAWFVGSARRRQEEERRRQAGSLRAQAKAQRAAAAQATDRASMTEQKSVAPQRVEEVAQSSPAEAVAAPAGHDDLLREADPVDPVPAEAGHHTGWAGPAGVLAVGGIQAGSFDDDEPDFADAENPFASTEDSHAEVGTAAEPVVGAADEPGPEDLPGYGSDSAGPDTDVPSAAETSAPIEEQPAAEADPPGAGASAEDEVDWVNGPVDEEAIDERPVDEVVDWINGPVDDEPVTVEVPDEQAAPSQVVAPAPRERRISSLEEVRDGGYGVGSAAPIDDGAQPLGHAIKAVRDGGAYLVPGIAGYDDVEPDVWFLDEQSAQAAGYHPGTDH